MREIIEKYLALEQKLEEAFGKGFEFNFFLDSYWKFEDNELWHGEEYREGDDYELDYCPEMVDDVTTCEEFTCFRVYDNGESYRIIFDNKNRINVSSQQS